MSEDVGGGDNVKNGAAGGDAAVGGGPGGSPVIDAEALAIANEVKSDREFAQRFREAVSVLTELMNEAAERSLVISFNINQSDDMTQNPPRRVYKEVTSVVRAV